MKIDEPEGAVTDATIRSLQVTWRATARQYGARSAILESLEESALLRSFKMTEEGVSAGLTPHVELLVNPAGMLLSTFGEDFAEELMQVVLGVILERVQPERCHVVARFQHLVPIDADYDFVRSEVARRYLPLIAADYAIDDFAILADGKTNGGTDLFMLEFGVVSQREVPDRLAGTYSRLPRHGLPAPSPRRRWRASDFPPVSLYVESMWHSHGERLDRPQARDVTAGYEHLCGQASALVTSLWGTTRAISRLKEAN